jgi:hypothetical protein
VQLYRLDLSTNPPSWTLVKITGPSARQGHAMASVHHKVYLFGGADGQNMLLSDLWTLEVADAQVGLGLSAMTWTELSVANTPSLGRHGHSLVVFGSNLLLMGGGFDVFETPDRAMHVLQTSNIQQQVCSSNMDVVPPGFLLNRALCRQCKPCTVCQANNQTGYGEYQISACNATHDTVCRNCTQCPENFWKSTVLFALFCARVPKISGRARYFLLCFVFHFAFFFGFLP